MKNQTQVDYGIKLVTDYMKKHFPTGYKLKKYTISVILWGDDDFAVRLTHGHGRTTGESLTEVEYHHNRRNGRLRVRKRTQSFSQKDIPIKGK